VELLRQLRNALGERPIHVVGDSAYGGKSITRHLPERTVCISRLPMSAALFGLPPKPRVKRGRTGRPRKKGERVDTPQQMADQSSGWRSCAVHLYGKKVPIRYKTAVALWYNSARNTPLRIVVVRDPKGRRKDESFFSTDAHMPITTILETYAQRWSLEVAFRDVKQQLGFERSQARTAKAVGRTAPFAFVTYTLTVAWFCQCGHHHYAKRIHVMPWYKHKRAPSFADMQQLLRTAILERKFCDTPTNIHAFPKSTKTATHDSKRAA
jgi:hypothetical protein